MKKIFLLLLLGTLLLSLGVSAKTVFQCPVGATCTVLQMEKPSGIMPDSPLYKLDVWWDNMKIRMASKEAKVRLMMEVADERLLEMQQMAEKEKPLKLEVARKNYDVQIVELEKTNSDFTQRLSRHLEVLNLVRDKLVSMNKTRALSGIDNAIIKSSKVKKRMAITIKEGEVLRDEGQTITTQEEADKDIEHEPISKVTEATKGTSGIFPIPTTAGDALTGFNQQN